MIRLNRRMRAPLFLLAALLPAACVTQTGPRDLSAFKDANIHSVLVVPPLNRTQEVAAPDYYISTIGKPLAERGYYVFPVHAVKRVLEEDGLYDANLVHEADARHLGELFGADSILYVTVENWQAEYIILSTTLKVKFAFTLKRGDTGETVWTNQAEYVYDTASQTGGQGLIGLVAKAITAAMTKANPNYMPYVRASNVKALFDPNTGLPPGPYAEEYKNPEKDPNLSRPGT